MDPEANLKTVWLLLRQDRPTKADLERAIELLDDYAEWRQRDGFEPKLTVTGDALAVILKRATYHQRKLL